MQIFPATASYSCQIQSQSINNGFLLAIFISGYLRNVGFIMMVSQRLYQDLREAASQNFLTETEAEGITCTVSLGVKMLDHNDHTIDEAVKRADDAMYKAKDSGRNCVV